MHLVCVCCTVFVLLWAGPAQQFQYACWENRIERYRKGPQQYVRGKIEPDGDVRDQNNMFVGKIEKDGTIRDRSNMMVGKVDSDGEVKDRNNMLIGRVKSDGTVVDRNNMTVGYAKGIPATYAAVFFFFKMFE